MQQRKFIPLKDKATGYFHFGLPDPIPEVCQRRWLKSSFFPCWKTLMMEKRGIVVGPKTDVKEERAKSMRRAMTPAERCLWEQLRNNRCGGLHFRRQQVIDGSIADFYCHEAALVIEVDGDVHQQQVDYDFQRDRIIAARGLRIIRIPNERLFTELAVVLRDNQDAARRDQSSD